MKILKFLIVALSIVAVQCAWAVTLPSTSYTPHSGGDGFSSQSVYGSGSLITGTFSALGDTDTGVCATETPDVPASGTSCEDCCESQSFADDDALYLECVNKCEQGASLPLDAPLWFMLALASVGAAFTVILSDSEESHWV